MNSITKKWAAGARDPKDVLTWGPVVRLAWFIPRYGKGASSWMFFHEYVRGGTRVEDMNARYGTGTHWLEFLGE